MYIFAIRMKIPCKIAALICHFYLCIVTAYGQTATDSLMEQLDVAIAQRDTYIEQKEKRIAELNSQLYTADNDYSRFHILDNLYGEYHPFNTDSAYNISIRQEAIAKRIGDENLLQNARMNRANILNTTGMYHECLVLMDSVKLKPLPDYLRPYYYHIMRTIYGMMADYAAFHEDKSKYFELTNLYRDSIISVNDTGSLAHVITKSDFLNVSGEAEEAVKLMNSFMRDNNLSEHDKAICAWTLSEAYGRTGERELQKENLIISAISDLKSAVREYISLRQLALMLYEEGDLDRAYNFMSIAVDDAAKCNARQRIIELNYTYPMINEIYVETVRKQKETLLRYISVIVVLAFMLIILLFYMRKQMIKIKNKNKEIATAYDKQNKLTEELYKSNKKLSEANYAIAENSELKEVYIGRYMDQCLVYIEKLDGYRKSLNRLVKTGKSDELKQLLKSSSVIDDELKAFYYQFDKTFLDLFPSFVEDFNKLLLPEEAIIPKKEGTLNSELRIYALIRLGITDSEKIAKFLRYSLTTIYNYRTKVRNKAKGDRNALETEVFNIGRTIK